MVLNIQVRFTGLIDKVAIATVTSIATEFALVGLVYHKNMIKELDMAVATAHTKPASIAANFDID